MPDLKWNKRWAEQAIQFRAKNAGKAESDIYGYHWSHPEQSSMGVIPRRFIKPYVSHEKTALEIGPGGGRFTQFLFDFKRLYLVEFNPEMFHLITDKFGHRPNVAYIRTNGTDFPGVPSGTIDYLCSFDVFVHLDIPLIKEYLLSIGEALSPMGNAVIHYADQRKTGAVQKGETFSKTTPEIMCSSHDLI